MGVFLVAAELSRRGFTVSPTSRNARGADILVTDAECKRAFSIQVKTAAPVSSYWLLNEHAKEMRSDSHVCVFVNIKKDGTPPEFFVVPSEVVARKMRMEKIGNTTWYSFSLDDALEFRDKWEILGR